MNSIQDFNDDEQLNEDVEKISEQILNLLELNDVSYNVSIIVFGMVLSITLGALTEEFTKKQKIDFVDTILSTYKEMILSD